ncbi:3-methyladenine DNA glycosylase AlkC [Chishuiella changwenlii]|uniref:3-methyladenine DNA glycosylase AlkC n=1 Tax=Chishuiella changwenlii TaxID=1434701 RepID=A0A1M7B2E9_9FLAO|nr:DNA alkylation repair protein [Chishuiella changwenlii]GGE95646.1 DNA alkylation repair protein [Chishuiella changwenlii]SHL49087.1 3-methyladenine DNA glycosylase AlkC [Chishuiella changwenlii]
MKRKGARSTKDIPTTILEQLNNGEIETVNLVEWLAVDQQLLLKNLLKQHNRSNYLKPILSRINQLKKQTVNTINEAIGLEIFELTNAHNDKEFLNILSQHKADLIRCWATYTIGKNEQLNITDTLIQLQPFAADHHFGVREISWMVTREKIIHNLEESIKILTDWATNEDENIRRFATESTRPRGVWCEHIEELKQQPVFALPILESLKSDTSKYVQDSVGNWLNDASKTQPEFVKNLCLRWENESNTKETKYIIKKALRTLNK